MTGTRPSLRSGTRIVVDTHIFDDAVKQARSGESGKQLELFVKVLSLCPVVLLSRGQLNELRARGIRFPVQMPAPVRDLDQKDKLEKVPESKLGSFRLPDSARKAFVGNLKDDIHLYETALSGDGIVVTQDETQLGSRRELSAATGVTIYDIQDVLEMT